MAIKQLSKEKNGVNNLISLVLPYFNMINADNFAFSHNVIMYSNIIPIHINDDQRQTLDEKNGKENRKQKNSLIKQNRKMS